MRSSASVAVRPGPRRLRRLQGSSFEIHAQKVKPLVDSRGRKKGESRPERKKCFHTFILQVQAGRRECVSSAASLYYRTLSRRVEGGQRGEEREREGSEREQEGEIERENGRSLIQISSMVGAEAGAGAGAGAGVGGIRLAPATFSAVQHEKREKKTTTLSAL